MKKTYKTEIDTDKTAVFINKTGKHLFIDVCEEGPNRNFELLDLSSNNIKKIENIPESVRELYLKNNPIKSITQDVYDRVKIGKLGIFMDEDIDELKVI